MSPSAGLDLLKFLLKSAHLRSAMRDPLSAIDLFDLTGRMAVKAYLISGAPSPDALALLEPVAEPPEPLTLFALEGQCASFADTAGPAGAWAAMTGLLNEAFDGKDVINWPKGRELHEALLSHYSGRLPCLARVRPEEAAICLEIALAAFEGLLEVRPIPLVLRSVENPGDESWDKDIYVLPGKTGGFRDGGFAFDRGAIVERLLAIAKVSLPPEGQSRYFRQAANNCFDQGDNQRAEALLRTSLTQHPNPDCHGALLRCLIASPSATEADLFEESRYWAELYAHEENLPEISFPSIPDPDKILRIGYICDFIGTTLAQYTLIPLFAQHDRKRVCVVFYNGGSPDNAARGTCDLYRDIRRMSQDEQIATILNDQVDILVDLNGRLRESYDFEVFCRKPATILVNWYNLLASTGLKAFDYIVTDELSQPKAKQALCTEEIVHLGCQSAGSWSLPEDPQVAPVPALTRGTFVFSFFGHALKLSPQVLQSWVRLLKETRDTALYIKNISFYNPACLRRLKESFLAAEISEERLRFEHGSKVTAMRELYADVDLALDSFPYGNGSTTIHATWQGVPTLTWATEEWRGRTSASIMASAGLPEFIVSSAGEYLERAKFYASHPEALVPIRAQMRSRLAESGYYNISIFTRSLEEAYRYMWRQMLRKCSPERAI